MCRLTPTSISRRRGWSKTFRHQCEVRPVHMLLVRLQPLSELRQLELCMHEQRSANDPLVGLAVMHRPAM